MASFLEITVLRQSMKLYDSGTSKKILLSGILWYNTDFSLQSKSCEDLDRYLSTSHVSIPTGFIKMSLIVYEIRGNDTVYYFKVSWTFQL